MRDLTHCHIYWYMCSLTLLGLSRTAKSLLRCLWSIHFRCRVVDRNVLITGGGEVGNWWITACDISDCREVCRNKILTEAQNGCDSREKKKIPFPANSAQPYTLSASMNSLCFCHNLLTAASKRSCHQYGECRQVEYFKHSAIKIFAEQHHIHKII